MASASLVIKLFFVPDTAPGDTICVKITEDKGTYIKGIIEKIIEESPDRVKPFCKYADICGGCQWQHINYPVQAEWKERIVRESFSRIAKTSDAPIETCVSSPALRNFRTVARYPLAIDSGKLGMGYFERNTHNIVDIDNCPVASEIVNSVAEAFRKVIDDFPANPVLREITIQSSLNGDSLVRIKVREDDNLSRPSKILLSENEYIKGINVRRVFHDGGEKTLRTYGNNFRNETVGGLEFKISEGSFFQVNPSQAENLVKIVREMTEGLNKKTIIDAYGGVGLFSLSIADNKSTIHLFDISESAVSDSIANAGKAGVKLVPYTLDALHSFEKIGKADLIIADPPRTGLGRKVVNAACASGAKNIIYISCNPTTLARDIAIFAENGYSPERIVPVDMFAHTYHIETVVKLVKK